MPKTKARPGRKPERFSYSGTFEDLASTVARKKKPATGWPTPETMTKKPRKPKR